MWFRKNGVVFRIVIPHCTAVLMTRVGSGAVSKVQHGVSGGKNDILFAFLGMTLYNDLILTLELVQIAH
jgi:hypothetical protein